MLNNIQKRLRADEGFTLIELLVVIIIIGILAAIAIPVFLNQRQKGYEASMKSDLRTVANEEETFFTDNNTYAAVTTASGKATVAGGNAVTVSTGNTITSKTADATGFCLDASSTKATSAVWSYQSANGGLVKAACP